MELKQKRACIVYSVSALFAALIYSYKDAKWVNEKYAMFFKRGDTSSPIYIVLIYSALIVLTIIAVLKICENRRRFLYGAEFVLMILFYFIKSILEDGMYLAITSPTTPIIYILALAVFVGMDGDIWETITKCLPILIIIHIVLFAYEYVVLVAEHGVVVVGNSSLIYYFVSLFWCSVIYLSNKVLREEGIGFCQMALIGCNVIFAVIINSRSWIIQSCFVGIAIYFFSSSGRNIRSKIFRLMLLVLMGYIVLQILNFYFPSSMILLYNKLGQNSRSHQYAEITKASSLLGWFFGNGATAVYYDSAQGNIANIDNQYLFISFHYGAIFMLMWLGPQLVAFVSVLKRGSKGMILLLPILCWFMALGGLSIFNAVYCDLKQVLIMLYIGHILSLNNNGGYADE